MNKLTTLQLKFFPKVLAIVKSKKVAKSLDKLPSLVNLRMEFHDKDCPSRFEFPEHRVVSLKHVIDELHPVHTTLEELDLAFGHCWYDRFMFNIDQPKLQRKPISYRQFTGLRRLYLLPEVISMDEPFSRVIPANLRVIQFYGINHELRCWLETLPAQLHAFPNLESLVLCTWGRLEEEELADGAASDDDPPKIDYGQVLNDFVKKFDGVDIKLIIFYDEDRGYDMEATANMEYAVDLW